LGDSETVVAPVLPAARSLSLVTLMFPMEQPSSMDGVSMASGGAARLTLASQDGADYQVTTANATEGTCEVSPDGTVVFTPTDGFVGATMIEYTVSDGKTTSQRQLVINVAEPAKGAPSQSSVVQSISVSSEAGKVMPLAGSSQQSDASSVSPKVSIGQGLSAQAALKERQRKSNASSMATSIVSSSKIAGTLRTNSTGSDKAAAKAKRSEVERLSILKAAEEAASTKQDKALQAEEEAAAARSEAQRAGEESARAEQLKVQGHAQWARTRTQVVLGARMGYAARVALAGHLTSEADKQKRAAVAATLVVEQQKVEEKERKAEQVCIAAVNITTSTVVAQNAQEHIGTASRSNSEKPKHEPKIVITTALESAPAEEPAPATRTLSIGVELMTMGEETTTLEDGTTITTFPDGTVVQTSVDGIVITTSPDGTVVQTNPDGVQIATYVDGTVVQTNPDGVEITTQPDGSLSQVSPDGTTTFTLVSGVQIVVQPDGTQYQTDPATPDITIVTNPDGTQVQQGPDGVMITTNLDGSTVQQNTDGSTVYTRLDGEQTITRADGTSYLIHLNGEIEELGGGGKASSSVVLATVGLLTSSYIVTMFENTTFAFPVTKDLVGAASDFTIERVSAVEGAATIMHTGDEWSLSYTPPINFTGDQVVTYWAEVDGRAAQELSVNITVNKVPGDLGVASGLNETSDWSINLSKA